MDERAEVLATTTVSLHRLPCDAATAATSSASTAASAAAQVAR